NGGHSFEGAERDAAGQPNISTSVQADVSTLRGVAFRTISERPQAAWTDRSTDLRSLRRELCAAMTAVAAFQPFADVRRHRAPTGMFRDLFQLRDRKAPTLAADDVDRHPAFP